MSEKKKPNRLTLHPLAGGQQAIEELLMLATEGQTSGHPSPQIQIICRYLRAQGAIASVWQRDVQDPDFLAEHGAYYARWSYKVPRFCHRLHFFATPSTADDVLDAIEAWSAETEPAAYLGFVTIRPVVQSPIGATFLKRPEPASKDFVHAQDRFPVNLAGWRLYIEATPFMQQDNAVGACAQAAIWMALRTLRWREGRSALNPAQITSSATRFFVSGRTLPNRQGLRLEQITEVVRSAGYSPHLIQLRSQPEIQEGDFDATSQASVQQKLYPYVESGIPVLLALTPSSGGHAVVVIGHRWNSGGPDPGVQGQYWQRRNTEFIDASAWARPFLIHNDNTGPYLELPALPSAGEYALQHAAWAIPLLPAEILVDAAEAKTACLGLVTALFASETFKWPAQVVTRMRLLPRAKFRETICQSEKIDSLKRYFRMKWLPSYIWLLECYGLDGYSQATEGQARKIAEVLLEPNADPLDGHFLCAVAHDGLLAGDASAPLVVDRDPFEGDIKLLLMS